MSHNGTRLNEFLHVVNFLLLLLFLPFFVTIRHRKSASGRYNGGGIWAFFFPDVCNGDFCVYFFFESISINWRGLDIFVYFNLSLLLCLVPGNRWLESTSSLC